LQKAQTSVVSLSLVTLTPENSLSAVSLTPVNNLSPVSLIPVRKPKGLKFIADVNDTAKNLLTGVNTTDK
jgi:hypothetical protein